MCETYAGRNVPVDISWAEAAEQAAERITELKEAMADVDDRFDALEERHKQTRLVAIIAYCMGGAALVVGATFAKEHALHSRSAHLEHKVDTLVWMHTPDAAHPPAGH